MNGLVYLQKLSELIEEGYTRSEAKKILADMIEAEIEARMAEKEVTENPTDF